MPSGSDESRTNWELLGSILIWGIVCLGLILGFAEGEADAVVFTLGIGWGLFGLFFLWRITRAVEHLAYGSG